MSEHGEDRSAAATEREALRDLVPAYLAGELSEAEARELEARLEGDAELESEVRSWSETLADLAESGGPPIEPTASVRSALLGRVAASAAESTEPEPAGAEPVAFPVARHDRRPPGGAAWSGMALAAGLGALVIALGASWLQISGRDRLDALQAERDALEARVRVLETSEQASRRRLDQLGAAVRGLVDPGRQPVVLASLPDQPEASGAAFYRGGGAIFYAFDLPALTAEQTYQLWYIGEDGPVSAGVFEVDALGEATVSVAAVPSPESIAVWAVTVEPAGGVPQPTGPMVIRS